MSEDSVVSGEPSLTGESSSNQAGRMWAMLLHLSCLAGYAVPMAGFVVPIVIWQVKKAEFPELDVHGKIVANFLVSMVIYGFIAFLLCFVFIGIPLLIALGVIAVVFPIIGGIKASSGEVWQYPLMLNLVQ